MEEAERPQHREREGRGGEGGERINAPSSGDVVRQRGTSFRHAAGKAKVAEFQLLSRRVDEQVLRLDVSVDHVVLVAPINGFHQLWRRKTRE